MHVAYSELVRVMPDALRGLGFPIGQADDAAEGVIWTECVMREGYALLRLSDECRPARGWPRPAVVEEGQGRVRVALAGSPIFAVGPRLVDLARVAASAGIAVVVADGGLGGAILPFMVHRLARAGHQALGLWLPGPRSPSGEAPPMLAGAAPGRDGSRVELVIVPGGPGAAAPREGDADGADPSLLPAMPLIRDAVGARSGSLLVLIAAPAGAGPPAAALRRLAAALGDDVPLGAPGTVDAEALVRRAIEQGLEAEAHGVMTGLAARLRVPSSERSRGQAG